MDRRISPAAIGRIVRTGTVTAAAMLVVAVAVSEAVAQTASTPAPRIQPDSFATPSTAKTVPAKPTKSCSIYGDGFVQVPGTDTCVKMNGYVRSQTSSGR
jgi:hypothetical protein